VSTEETEPEKEVCGTPNAALFLAKLKANNCDSPDTGVRLKVLVVLPAVKDIL